MDHQEEEEVEEATEVTEATEEDHQEVMVTLGPTEEEIDKEIDTESKCNIHFSPIFSLI